MKRLIILATMLLCACSEETNKALHAKVCEQYKESIDAYEQCFITEGCKTSPNIMYYYQNTKKSYSKECE